MTTTNNTMTSTQLAEMLGYSKKQINLKVKDMFSDKIDGNKILPSLDARGYVVDYNLPELESKMFVAKWDINYLEKITQYWIDNKKPKTQLEILAGSIQALVNHEKQLNEHKLLIDEQAKQIEEIKESSMILPSKPVNAMSVTYIRQRINADYGLPARIINEVLYSIHYAPKPAGQVRNTNEHAGNSTYTVWNKSEVTKLFNRFISECEMATKTQAVHPSIDGRFKLVKNK